MMRSRAAAALLKLKEMDRKYSIKRNEVTRGQSNVSTDTSLEATPRMTADAPVRTQDTADSDDSHGFKVIPKSEDHSSNDDPSAKSISRMKTPEDTVDDLALEDDTVKSDKISPVRRNSFRRSSDLASSMRSISSESKGREQSRSAGSGDRAGSKDESSVATILSKASEISEVSEVVQESLTGRREGKETEAEEKIMETNMKELKEEDSEEAIEVANKISERSDIVSELIETLKKNDSVIGEERKVQYESDTFEQVSSSTASSSYAEDRSKEMLREQSYENTVRSGVKQVMITVHMQPASARKTVVEDSPEEIAPKEKKIIELVPPKIVQSTSECEIGLDEELSNYVKTSENVDEVEPITLLKSLKQTTPRKHPRRGRKQRKPSENIEDTRKISESSEVSDQERPRHSQNSSSATIEAANLEKQKDPSREDESRADEAKAEDEYSTSSEKLLRETPKNSDVTWTLRNLNRDAIDAIARRYRFHSRETKSTKKCGTVVKLPTAKHVADEWKDSRTGSLDNLKDTNADQKRRRTTSKRSSKSSKTRKTTNRIRLDEKQSRFDCRHARKLRKQAAALRQQQEREDIRNYLLELEQTRLEYGIGDPAGSGKIAAIKPLEFPKIAAFEKPDPTDADLKSEDKIRGLQDRMALIKQWMKDQYTLYRDYSNIARTMNAKYVPASLEDAKRTIRQLQKATIKTR
ncbi:uncharacterized protein LOC117220989 [Megalopta genalis]|uniref:uncharacterized protein LOC117220989 n=1 Tax=Megalopta genalis TaxID=115081 RepID=UPI003FD56461